MKILLVEDEKSLSDVLVRLLKQNGYAVDAAFDGASGLDQALTDTYDAVVLDIMLPKKNGLDVLAAIRDACLSTPVLLLTAKSDVEDRIKGLDLGADDYLPKPFATGELLARLRAVTRRRGEYIGEELRTGDTALDLNTHELKRGAASIKLGLKEYQIIEMLMRNNRQVIPKERFIEKIWGYDSEAEYNTVEVYISFLRKKLTAIHSALQIKAVRGVGYALEEPAS